MAHEEPLPLLVDSAAPAPFHISGRRVQASLSCSLLRGLLCIACLMGVIWLTVLVSVCVLLQKTNTEQVHTSCPGFWDFTLVSVLSPFLLPLLFLLSSSVLSLSWSAFSTAWLVTMTLFSVSITLAASMSLPCVETLRQATPPFPWLLFVGWVKTAMYMAGSISGLWRTLRAARE